MVSSGKQFKPGSTIEYRFIILYIHNHIISKGCRPSRRPRKVGQSAWSRQAAKQHLIACRNRAQTYPQKLPNVPSEFLEKKYFSVSCSCCLVSKLQASGLQNGPFATAKQHLIPVRNRAQTYPQKLPNVPSEFLEKKYFSVSCSCCLVSKLQASGLQNGPFATAKQHLIPVRNRAQTYPQKLPNVPSEFLEKVSFFVSCSCCLVAPSCKHQASRTYPSPQQNST